MTAIQAVGVFIGLPLLFALVVFILVSAPGWLRTSRGADDTEIGPVLLTSARPLPDPSRLPDELSPAGLTSGGGAHGQW